MGKKKKKKKSASYEIIMRIPDIAFLLSASWYIFISCGLLPLYIKGYSRLGTDKARFWMGQFKVFGVMLFISLIMLALRLIFERYYLKKKIKLPKPVISDYFAAAFLVSVSLSYLFSEHKDIALYGERGWFMGTVQYIILALCVIILPRIKYADYVYAVTVLLSSFAVCVIGIAICLDDNGLGIEGWYEGKISVLGNANWACGYFVSVLFVSVAFFYLREQKKNTTLRILTALLIIHMLAGSFMMIAQASSSGYIALYAVFLILLYAAADERKKLIRIPQILLVFSAGCIFFSIMAHMGLIPKSGDDLWMIVSSPLLGPVLAALSILFMIFEHGNITKNKTRAVFNPGRILVYASLAAALVFLILLTVNTLTGGKILGTGNVFYYGDRWASSRGITTKIGFKLFGGMSLREKLTGAGPDCFYVIQSEDRFLAVKAEAEKVFGAARLVNAHSEPVTMLVNTGILGVVSFYGMLLSITAAAYKASKDEKGVYSAFYKKAAFACVLCISAYIMNNIFSFQTAQNFSQLTVLAGIGAGACVNAPSKSVR